ncbi:hypothetical protein M2421_001957 [Stenotrophomonas sp. BIGb0135]|nr:hypothetical protein [Stenotrophomonas sp. BIGb0135]
MAPDGPGKGVGPSPRWMCIRRLGREKSMQNRRPVAPVLRYGPSFHRWKPKSWTRIRQWLRTLPFVFAVGCGSGSTSCPLPFAFCSWPFALGPSPPFTLCFCSLLLPRCSGSSTNAGSHSPLPHPPIRTSQLSGRGVGGLAGPLGAMDGAHEPPGMDLRRVPPTHPPRANHQHRNHGLWLWLWLWLWLALRLVRPEGKPLPTDPLLEDTANPPAGVN